MILQVLTLLNVYSHIKYVSLRFLSSMLYFGNLDIEGIFVTTLTTIYGGKWKECWSATPVNYEHIKCPWVSSLAVQCLGLCASKAVGSWIWSLQDPIFWRAKDKNINKIKWPLFNVIPTIIYNRSLLWSYYLTTKPANTWHASNSQLKWLYTNTANVFCRKCSVLSM